MIQEISPLETIRTHGRRLTPQRRLILEILQDSQEHLDAEALYLRAKARDPDLGLATVYRTLALLKETGLVEEHLFGEDHGHFETPHRSPHYHFTCLGCGQVIELQVPQVTRTARALCEQAGLQLSEIHFHLSGYCKTCQENRPASAAPGSPDVSTGST